jgi:hypothetical protein
VVTHRSGDDFIVDVEIESYHHLGDVALALALYSIQGAKIVSSWTKEIQFPVELQEGKQWFRCQFKAVCIRPGQRFCVSFWMAAHDVIDAIDNVAIVDVIDGKDTSLFSNRTDQGIILYPYEWTRLEGNGGLNS